MASIRSSFSAGSACLQLMVMLFRWFLFPARGHAVSSNGSDDVQALLSFRKANSVGPWSTWEETNATPCAWVGVRCSANDTVEEIDFSGWGLLLETWEPLYQLKGLRRIDLSYNSLYAFPEGIGNFTELTWLDLSRTGVYFDIPTSISACLNMRVLSLEQTMITTVSPRLRDLVNLQSLNLAGNGLTGPFPTTELEDLSSLVSLDLSRNLFTGSIPALPKLTNLVALKLDNNSFTAFEEPWFLGTKSLQQLSVSNNSLQGSIPSSITLFSELVHLDMSLNNLSGTIPYGFSAQFANGFSLDLSQNQLTGEIPTDMLPRTNMRGLPSSVNLSHNLLTGTILIPQGSKLPRFSVLDLSHNNLIGPVPSDISSDHLWLHNNQLSGDIVDILIGSGVARTIDVRLQNNLFTGDLSRMANISLHNLFSLQVLDVSNNHLQWSTSEAVPDPVKRTLQALTTSHYLKELRAGGNNFSGTSLPTACFINSTLIYGLSVLDLSNSDLNGEILDSAFGPGCLPAIQLLNLSNNYATGPLSEGIIAQHGPQFVVDVSNNNLSGGLPLILPSSNLYNPKYFAGNGGLCGDPLPPCPQMPLRPGLGVPWWVLLIIIGGSVTIAMGSCLAATWRWRVYQKQHQQDADLIKTLLERDSASLMSLRELKKATDNFADSVQIGEGGFGTVYTGKLNDGTIVAIKKSKREGSAKDKEQFLNEVRILSHVNHRHLVKLLGCCMENKIALLVFEYVSNGTLQQHLEGKIEGSQLSWKQRLSIAVQTADALNYLHSAATFPIFHRDVKSANILLNEALDAKVADFGISKLAPLHATHVSTAGVQGTLGYIDPEYYTSFQLTDKSDVYSFGVVLLELISAKAALDFHRGEDETGLVNLARPYLESANLEKFIDPVLIETYKHPTGLGKESILNVGRLASKCLDLQSRRRPSMNEVLKELQRFWQKFTGTYKNLESVHEDGREDLPSENNVLLSSFGNRYTSTADDDGSGRVEMSQLSPLPRFRSRSMG